jgi:thiamine-phosphate pyrophosphorylase
MAIVSSAEAGLRAAPRATILQLRAPDLSGADLEREATRLVSASPIPVLVSARCDVVLASGAAGVNLPQRDIPTADARALLGDRLVGRSVHSREGALEAERDGADYVIFGPVWASTTHPDVAPVGVDALSEVAAALRIPVLAIGGVTQDRIAECHGAGAAGFAAIGLFS